ncbi:unnamed protein product [Camellia sinensis]
MIASSFSRGSDAHTTLELFKILSSYSWDAKVLIALAAFSIQWGDSWMQYKRQHRFMTRLAQYLLMQADSLKPTFEALTDLIKAMMDVTKCIVEFKELPPQYITSNMLEMVIPSPPTCSKALYIASTKEAKELSSLAHVVSNIHSHLQKQLTLCYQHVEEKKYNEAFQKLVRLFEATHIDNINILKALVSAKEDQFPLFDGSTKRKVSIDVLRNKNVLLLISDLDLSNEEYFIVDQIYTESKQQPTRLESQYEVVWLPVMDRTTPWNDEKGQKFEAIQASISWYSVYHPLMLDPVVIKYIKEVWHFNKKALLVVLDPQGKVVNPNAIHMCWIWGNLAFPFTSLKEKELWKETPLTIELLADTIDQSILNWIVDEKYICLYGGDDLEWIQRFTKTAQAVAAAAHIQLEMLYVGKSKARGTVPKISNTILLEKLSHVLSDPTLVWFFWVRLESMWHSKRQHAKSVENDPIMQEIMTILCFDGNDQPWAVISRGTAEMTEAKGDTMLQSLAKFEEWKDHAKEVGFVNALIDKLYELHTPEYCNHMILSGTTENILERVVCVECGRPMEKFIMYRCCN